MSFTYKVFKVIMQIPRGEVMTYKEVAKFAGNEKAYNAVGNIIQKNPDKKRIPCHRVIRSDLTLSKNYHFSGIKYQKKKLIKEGIKFNKNKIILD